ncbi:MAG: sodium:proton antiporter [Cyanobacteriota bacterium]|nr:sodium:proton antiporter [Cyanobacteriota bacterium]
MIAWLLSTGFRLLLWFLLTSDGTALNLLIGLALAVSLPRSGSGRWPLRRLGPVMLQSLVAIPRAYAEAVALVVAPAERERFIVLSGSGNPSPLVVFLEVFAITLTPFTIVLGVQSDANALRYRVHQLLPSRAAGAIKQVTTP